jgi:hypothetical protein
MISLWRRTLEPTDLRVELRDGDIMMGNFDNREEALDWLWERINEADDRIREHERQIADEEKSVQEMLDFLTDISNTNWSHKLLDADTQPLYEGKRRKWFDPQNTTLAEVQDRLEFPDRYINRPEDASGLEGKLPKALLEPPDRLTELKCDECGNPFDDAEGATCQTCLDWVVKG